MKKNIIFLFLTFLFFNNAFSNAKNLKVQIKLFSYLKVNNVTYIPNEAVALFDGKKKIGIAYKSQVVTITANGNQLNVKIDKTEFPNVDKLRIENEDDKQFFKLKTANNAEIEREYQGNLLISSDSVGLKIVNTVDLESYVSGVVEAEVGSKQSVEFYKTKAIICRTYALKEFKKHKNEDFFLCDAEHCQVYKGICKSNDIINAVKLTANQIIVDKNQYLITAAFHSNCGGTTCNSEDVWSLPTSYLKSVVDTFCLNQSRAKWEKKIALSDWINYLSSKYNYPAIDIVALRRAMNWTQFERQIYFTDDSTVALKNVRADLELKSTFFTIRQDSDSLLFTGRGSGHGVGLCQQGAMRMSELGYTHQQIINFYYKDTQIINYTEVKDKLLK